MSITFQKNFWGLVVPEPWSSKTSADEESPNSRRGAGGGEGHEKGN